MRMKDVAITAEAYGFTVDEVTRRPELFRLISHFNAATDVCTAVDAASQPDGKLFWMTVNEALTYWKELLKH